MKFLVTGSREFTDRGLLEEKLNFTLCHASVILIHGNAKGADQLAHQWCLRNPRVYEIKVGAKWELLGKPAGMARNRIMAELRPDRVLAFYKTGAENRGTSGMVEIARQMSINKWDIEEYWA